MKFILRKPLVILLLERGIDFNTGQLSLLNPCVCVCVRQEGAYLAWLFVKTSMSLQSRFPQWQQFVFTFCSVLNFYCRRNFLWLKKGFFNKVSDYTEQRYGGFHYGQRSRSYFHECVWMCLEDELPLRGCIMNKLGCRVRAAENSLLMSWNNLHLCCLKSL